MRQGTFLALRKTNAPGFFPGIFSKLVRARIVTEYPHAGIIANGKLLHITKKDGLHAVEDIDLDQWDLFIVDIDSSEVLERFRKHGHCKYDLVSLLAFVLPWRVSVSEWLYCYEWCFVAITGKLPMRRVTPEDLLTFTKGKYVDK